MLSVGTGFMGQCTRYAPRVFNRSFAAQVPELFSYYMGPGGLKRIDSCRRIEVFNHKELIWKRVDDSFFRSIIQDSSPSTGEEAAAYMQQFKEKAVKHCQ